MVAKQELGGNCVPKQELGNEQKKIYLLPQTLKPKTLPLAG
jgi:hypothetical protein